MMLIVICLCTESRPTKERYSRIPLNGTPLNDEQEQEDFRNIPNEVGYTLFRAHIQIIRPMSAFFLCSLQ